MGIRPGSSCSNSLFTYIYLEPWATGLPWPDSYSHGPTLPITKSRRRHRRLFCCRPAPTPPRLGIVAGKHWQPEALVIDKQ